VSATGPAQWADVVGVLRACVKIQALDKDDQVLRQLDLDPDDPELRAETETEAALSGVARGAASVPIISVDIPRLVDNIARNMRRRPEAEQPVDQPPADAPRRLDVADDIVRNKRKRLAADKHRKLAIARPRNDDQLRRFAKVRSDLDGFHGFAHRRLGARRGDDLRFRIALVKCADVEAMGGIGHDQISGIAKPFDPPHVGFAQRNGRVERGSSAI